MTSYILEINEKNSFARKLIELIIDYSKMHKGVSLRKEYNSTTKKAIDEVNEDIGETYNKPEDFFNNL